MRFVSAVFLGLLPGLSLFAPPVSAGDPRNQPGYHVLFDLEAYGDSEIVDGYGSYLQWYFARSTQAYFRYCTNFEDTGVVGHPNLDRERKAFVPYGTVSDTAYLCEDFTPQQMASDQKVVYSGDRVFVSVRSASWSASEGGDLFLRVARRVPIFGTPEYRILRLRVTGNEEDDVWKTELLHPSGAEYPSHWLRFRATVSALGIPNGLDTLLLNPGEESERGVGIDSLERSGVRRRH